MPIESHTASCFDCRYPLDGLNSHECPECGRPFDPDDASTFNRVLSDPVKLTERPLVASVGLRLRLEHEGIPTALIEQTGGIIMYAPIPMAALYVNRDDEELSRQFMAVFDAAEQPLDADPGAWTCPVCNEQIDAPFDVCWNCGAERDAPHSTGD